ncbi:hypothetical protein FOXG_17851 [Fusarium oxysporum f. sp. lycopersici 4287]|uniref:Uncharacterized protein n=1 Tax=Fusarium oxysporum f. sp. lycopersici (strain 4287 / CBS 123668 / FGSC 9935 / NRRL 34936) TaxID=426428 RepID=A0A0J9U5M9_FUSO4|nr:hypothetical protein FOXG_17851 [Fusarium oxysporum f. sp. lycopersici 4287]KNA94117.1 hypothetical protein FOXG_17851 [Fusarium oxysporum f. sp. lycopersici 4287]
MYIAVGHLPGSAINAIQATRTKLNALHHFSCTPSSNASQANWISTTLESPLCAALLADECRTGKTVQLSLALATHYYLVKTEVNAGIFQLRDKNWRFKPSIILCLPAGG